MCHLERQAAQLCLVLSQVNDKNIGVLKGKRCFTKAGRKRESDSGCAVHSKWGKSSAGSALPGDASSTCGVFVCIAPLASPCSKNLKMTKYRTSEQA